MSSSDDLEAALMDAYKRAGQEVGYWGRRFLRGLRSEGAVATAKSFLKPRKSPAVSQGFQALLSAGRLDLSVESICLEPRFRSLFTPAELTEAQRRLRVSATRSIADITQEINRRAAGRPIGELQALRRSLRGLERVATYQIFDDRSVFDEYAFHVGGRTELQFNIGFEEVDGTAQLQHGVAFSLQINQSLPSIDPLLPRIARFNEYLRVNPDAFPDCRMWQWADDRRGPSYWPSPISPEMVRADTFIFLGKLQRADSVDVTLILDDFDRLLSLYKYVEGDESYPASTDGRTQFLFTPGCTVKPIATTASLAARELDISLRHNEIQTALHGHLSARHGYDNVKTEQPTGTGASIDIVVRSGADFWFYEIKTASSARACIREALAQLLEYSYWPGAQVAQRLIIVGEPILDPDAAAYLDRIRKEFSLSVRYQQFDMQAKSLVG